MEWLESTALAEWVRTSLVGYPLVLTVHSIGMAIMVGIVSVVDLRLIGWFKRIPYTALDNLIRVAWYGLAVNVITGAAIFTASRGGRMERRRRRAARDQNPRDGVSGDVADRNHDGPVHGVSIITRGIQ